ncbi:efflux RND transporter permease subunit [Geomonas sp. Red32]|uniref:efflux RND transporter permease subunit n=1 Tax=Geomonas sp. Red32 TaxID=2912856 RepID=UPI00202CEA9A|nr:efflux RND transporter permease subunit [Geomonas sp. Red32]MCM0083121.1 efflux RND transporter permease subunit [Geomonas sp. Red32]
MWIVRLALRRPYTVAVMALLILVLGALSASRMIIDIFPVIDIPVVAVAWNYPGLSPEDMERRVVLISERAYSTTVNGISRIESESIPGIGMLKIYFQPGTEIGAAISQIASVSNTLLRIAPPGMQPPVIVQYNASNVPVAQLTAYSKTLPEEKIFDYGLNFIRVRLFTIPGLSTPAPFGGKSRQIMIDVNPAALSARGLSPADVVSALQSSNVIIPAGTARMGGLEYNVTLNSSPRLVEQFASIPIKVVGNAPVYIGDVAKVSDSFAEQINVVRGNGRRATYLAILKHADASTLAVVDATRAALPSIRQAAPQGLELKLDFDQSVFVRGAVTNVIREALLASILVSLMILFFLGSWRSMIVVASSIPLAIFFAVIALNLAGQSINIMTLGGLALAIGMLVDDATVEVENIHRNFAMNKPTTLAVMDSAQQIAVPAIVATLSICIVFFPVVLLYGPSRYLFTPLAFAVVAAMLASYLLSRTLVPVLARMLLAGEHEKGRNGAPEPGHREEPDHTPSEQVHALDDDTHTPEEMTHPEPASSQHEPVPSRIEPTPSRVGSPPLQGEGQGEDGGRRWSRTKSKAARFIRRANEKRERGFDRFRDGYAALLAAVLHHRCFTILIALLIGLISSGLLFVVGTDFFPDVDAGIMKLHLRAPSGTRIEETEVLVEQVEQRIRQLIPADEIDTINDMIGVPTFYNLVFVQTENIGGMDAEILISLKKGHAPTSEYRNKIRRTLPGEFPGSRFYFQSADIVTQVLNFGLAAPIDVQIEGADLSRSYPYAVKLRDAMKSIAGMADVHINQVLDYPTLQVNVDRARAAQLGMSERDVATSALVSLSTSVLFAPSFFLNPANNVNYTVAVQVPRQYLNSMESLLGMPVTPSQTAVLQPLPTPDLSAPPQAPAQPLGNLAEVTHRVSAENITHYTVQRVLDVEGSVEGRDLGSVAKEIRKAITKLGRLPAGMKITLRGQNEVMTESFKSLALGLMLAILLDYFLMVVLFQSWLDPFIIMMAVPGALLGILWMLALTGTTINVESLMGSIMAVGIATSNSILMVSFANDLRVEKNVSPAEAALEAGKTRLRPVLMTALAMIIGMLPMALALGEAGEQNAPLGRAVIGGLLVATVVTLFVVPVIYSLVRTKLPVKHTLDERLEKELQAGHAGGGDHGGKE